MRLVWALLAVLVLVAHVRGSYVLIFGDLTNPNDVKATRRTIEACDALDLDYFISEYCDDFFTLDPIEDPKVVVVSEETATGSLDLWVNIDTHGIPVIVAGKDRECLEPLGLATGEAARDGSMAFDFVNPSHPLAAGYSGFVNFLEQAFDLNNGEQPDDPVIVAMENSQTDWPYFGLLEGADDAFGAPARGRRVFLGIDRTYTGTWSMNVASNLLGAAIMWVSRTAVFTSTPSVVRVGQPFSVNVTITTWEGDAEVFSSGLTFVDFNLNGGALTGPTSVQLSAYSGVAVNSGLTINAYGTGLTFDAECSNAGKACVGGTSPPFDVLFPLPVVTDVTPNSGGKDLATAVTITGTNLGEIAVDVSAANAVTVGGIAVTSLIWDSPNQIRCTIPASGSAGWNDVVVTTARGGTGLDTVQFLHTDPVITSVAPTAGPIAGGTRLTVVGSDLGLLLSDVVSVDLGGGAGPCTDIQDVSLPSSFSCGLPSVAGSTLSSVSVTTRYGVASGAVSYTYAAPPTVTGVSASILNPSGGRLTITGTDLGLSASDIASVTVMVGVECAVDSIETDMLLPGGIVCDVASGTPGASGFIVVTTTSGGASPGTEPFSFYSLPSITNVDPSEGPQAGGTLVTISGAHLGLDTDDVSVDVGGSPCTIVSLNVGADTLTCTTTVHAPAASASIVVSTVSGGSSSQPFTFAYRTTPSIASVTPTVGPTAGGARITVTGSNLADSAADLSVTVGGAACDELDTSKLPNEFVCQTPTGALGGADLVVTSVVGGVDTAANAYSYDDTYPVVTGVSPASGPIGGGTTIVVSGFNLGTGPITSATIGAYPCTSIDETNLPTSFECETTAGASGVFGVVVTTGGVAGVSEVFYTYSATPTVSAVSLPFVPRSNAVRLTVTGVDLGSAVGDIISVVIGAGAGTCTSVENVALPISFSCETEAGLAAGTYTLTVNTDSGGSGAVSAPLLVYADGPFVFGTLPRFASTNGGTAVTILGFQLGIEGVDEPVIDFGGTACAVSDASNLPDSVTCIVAAGGTPGVAPLNLTTSASPPSFVNPLVDVFTFVAPPVVSSITPTVGRVDATTMVTIAGSGFVDVLDVTVGASACGLVTVQSSGLITCTLPSGSAAGQSEVIVETEEGGLSAAGPDFAFVPGPSGLSISPSSGPSLGGTPVTISGINLGLNATADVISVTLGGMPCEDVVAVDGGGFVSEIQCSTPSLASGGSVDLEVATLFGVGNLSAAFDFVRCVDIPAGDCGLCIAHQATCGFCVSLNGCGTSSTCGDFVQACAEVDAIAPSSGATPGGTVVTVTGSSFTSVNAGGLQCRFGSSLAPVTVINDTALTCESPSVGSPTSVLFHLLYSGVQYDSNQAPLDFVYYTCDSGGDSCGACPSEDRPECGWCLLQGTCSRAVNCPVDVVFNNASCPTVSGVVPTSIPAAGGYEVTVTGTGFGTTVATLRCVYGGSEEHRATVVNSTHVTCPSPATISAADGVSLQLEAGSLPYAGASQAAIDVYDCATGFTCADCLATGSRCGWCDELGCRADNEPCPLFAFKCESPAGSDGDSTDGIETGLEDGGFPVVPIAIGAGVVALCLVGGAIFLVCFRKTGPKFGDEHGFDDDVTAVVSKDAMGAKVRAMLNQRSTKQLGRGLNSKVYRASTGSETVCLKVITNDDARARGEFQREVRALSKLLSREHPAIVELKFYVRENPVCVALEYCSNGDLKEFVRKKGRSLSDGERTSIAMQIASGMAVIHGAGIAHLDLKTANILVDSSKHMKIADFGISRLVDADGRVTANDATMGSEMATTIGSGGSGGSGGLVIDYGAGQGNDDMAFTPQYVDPLRVVRNADEVNLYKSDVFSFGSIVWVLAACEEPWKGTDAPVIIQRLEDDPSYRLKIPAGCDEILHRTIEMAWANEADERPDFNGLFKVLASALEDEHGMDIDPVYRVADVGETISYTPNAVTSPATLTSFVDFLGTDGDDLTSVGASALGSTLNPVFALDGDTDDGSSVAPPSAGGSEATHSVVSIQPPPRLEGDDDELSPPTVLNEDP